MDESQVRDHIRDIPIRPLSEPTTEQDRGHRAQVIGKALGINMEVDEAGGIHFEPGIEPPDQPLTFAILELIRLRYP